MSTAPNSPQAPALPQAAVFGFATAVAMWAAAWLLRLPGEAVPTAPIVVLVLLVQLGGGVAAGRFRAEPPGWLVGLLAGLITALLNLLALGSLVVGEDDQARPQIAVALGGYIAFSGALGAAAGALGARLRREPWETVQPNWLFRFAVVTTCAALLLLIAGGTVTSTETGLAVPDWPQTFGANLFLYPLGRMTGGVFIEHAHRLLGSLVGLTTLALGLWTISQGRGRWNAIAMTVLTLGAVGAVAGAWFGGLDPRIWQVVALAAIIFVIRLIATDRRRLTKSLAALAIIFVLIQGWLGGQRVVEQNVGLAMVHGITGQLFVALLALLTATLSDGWRRASPLGSDKAQRALPLIAWFALLIQIGFGAAVRHFDLQLHALISHATWSIVVLILVLVVGMRTAKRYAEQGLLRRLGRAMNHTVGLQMVLGLAALWSAMVYRDVDPPPLIDVTLTTAHQAIGAVLLILVTLMAAWSLRLTGAARPG